MGGGAVAASSRTELLGDDSVPRDVPLAVLGPNVPFFLSHPTSAERIRPRHPYSRLGHRSELNLLPPHRPRRQLTLELVQMDRSLIVDFLRPQAAGACWYLLGVQRAVSCLGQHCPRRNLLSCEDPVFYGIASVVNDSARANWERNVTARATCLDNSNGDFDYGVFEWAVPLLTIDSRVEKILLPLFWGIMTLM